MSLLESPNTIAFLVAYGGVIYLACLFGFGVERMQTQIKVLTARVDGLTAQLALNRRAP